MFSDNVTFTTIHMPLVRTPMITPSGDQGTSTQSPEWAAATIVRALSERPRRIDVPLGTLAEYGSLVAPAIKERVLHRYYRAIGDSPAAKGETVPEPETVDVEVVVPQRHRRTVPPAIRVTGTALRRAARLVPGTHW